jgi:hypothetical protein
MLAGVDRAGFSTQRGTQVNSAVRNSPAAHAIDKIVFADNLFHGAQAQREPAFDCTDIGSNVLFNG